MFSLYQFQKRGSLTDETYSHYEPKAIRSAPVTPCDSENSTWSERVWSKQRYLSPDFDPTSHGSTEEKQDYDRYENSYDKSIGRYNKKQEMYEKGGYYDDSFDKGNFYDKSSLGACAGYDKGSYSRREPSESRREPSESRYETGSESRYDTGSESFDNERFEKNDNRFDRAGSSNYDDSDSGNDKGHLFDEGVWWWRRPLGVRRSQCRRCGASSSTRPLRMTPCAGVAQEEPGMGRRRFLSRDRPLQFVKQLFL